MTDLSYTEEPNMVDSRNAIIAESLFVILPLIVLIIVLLHKGNGAYVLFASPEWSFAGAVFMGQTIVKLVYAASYSRGRRSDIEQLVLIIVSIIVLGLVPSLIVLSIMLTSETPPVGMIWLQLGLFVIGFTVFLLIGTKAHLITAMKRKWISEDKKKGYNA